MASKGIMLIRLPRLFGGDAVKGEAMLRRVLVLDPKAVSSRLVLAECCDRRGERDEALGLARQAHEIAQEQGRTDKIAEAQATLAKLGDAH
jgi:Tfp pilus assembly protein PilF